MKTISALALMIATPGVAMTPVLPYQAPVVVEAKPPTQSEILEPLADMIGGAESDTVGGYDAANNGYPMDLGKDGLIKRFGRPAAQIKVAEIMHAQSVRRVHAVGRYQIIGKTLRAAVNWKCISREELFTPEVQDRAMYCLIKYKRPAVWQYLTTGKSLHRAANHLALEWSSMPWTDGFSYYSGGDRAHVTRAKVFKVLQAVRRNAELHPEVLS